MKKSLKIVNYEKVATHCGLDKGHVLVKQIALHTILMGCQPINANSLPLN